MNYIEKLREELGEEKFKDIRHSIYNSYPYIHLKTGNEYYFKDIILDVTNATEGRLMIIYSNTFTGPGRYCREAKEFFEKFIPKTN